MTIIDCNNRPDFTIKEVRGSGYIYSAQFTEASSLSDLSEVYTKNALEETTPAIEIFGVEETVEALATAYAEVLSDSRRNVYDNTILTGKTPEVALESLEFNETLDGYASKVKDTVLVTNTYRDNFFANQFPAVQQRLEAGVINPIEFAEFVKDVGYESMTEVKTETRTNRFNFLKLLNFFLGGAAISNIMGSICSVLSNPFSGLTGIINGSLDAIEKAMSLKFGFLDIIEKAKKLLDIGKVLGKIKALEATFAKGIESLIDGAKRKVENLISNANSKIGKILNGEGVKVVGKLLQNKVNQVRNFFSDTNMKNLVDKAKESIGKFANQFKNITSTISDFIATSMCKVSNTVQEFVEAPMKSLEKTLDSVEGEKNALKNVSDVALKKSIEGGRPSITPEDKETKTKEWREAYRDALNAKADRNLPSSEAEEEEEAEREELENRTKEYIYVPEYSTHPAPTEWEWLSFGGQVLDPVQGGQKFWDADFKVNMVDYGGGFVIPKDTGIARDIGYYGVELEVLERANAVGEALQTKLTITSGFRHKIYNQYLRNTGTGAAKNSQHVQGKALDVVTTSMTSRERSKFIRKARVHGFQGVGRYRTFVHIDLGPKRNWSG